MIKNSKMNMPKGEDGSNAWLASHADDVFAKYDLDMTGEIEHDELKDDLVNDFMQPYMKQTKSNAMQLN